MPFTAIRLYPFILLCFILTSFSVRAALPADSTVSPDRLLTGTFANDATFRTDYYFTQGITATLVLPAFSQSPVNYLLLRTRPGQISYHGITIMYDGFTPLVIGDPAIRYGDRPYAAYLYSHHHKIINDKQRRQRLTSALDLGFIGPGAGAEKFQTKVHEWLDAPRPRGWGYQVQTDLVLGYQLAWEKQVAHLGRAAELLGSARASLGTLHTLAAGDFRLRTGKMNGYFDNLGISSRSNRGGQQKFQFYAQGRAGARAVGYNATLQGGLLNQRNPYTLRPDQVKRLVWTQSAGLVASYGGLSFESSVVWTSPEFDHARRHKWMHFDLKIAL